MKQEQGRTGAEPRGKLRQATGQGLERTSQWVKAREIYQQLIPHYPERPQAYHRQGAVYGQQGRHEETMAAFRRVGSDALFNLAFVKATQGDMHGAKQCFRAALLADPLHEAARTALKNFEQFDKTPELAALGELEPAGNYVPDVKDGGQAGGAADGPGHSSSGDVSYGIALPRKAGSATRALRQQAYYDQLQRPQFTTPIE